MKSCGMSCVKYLLFIFNFLFTLIGLALVVIGGLSLASISEHQQFIDPTLHAIPITVVVVGAIIFVIAFFGCCGAIRESHCMMITFAIFLMVIFVAEVAVGVVAVVNKDKVEEFTLKEWGKFVDEYVHNPSNTTVADPLNAVQIGFQCCGKEGPADYGIQIPLSCCPIKDPPTAPCVQADAFQVGCNSKFHDIVNLSATVLGGVAIGLAFIEIVGIVFALCMGSSIKNEERRRHY